MWLPGSAAVIPSRLIQDKSNIARTTPGFLSEASASEWGHLTGAFAASANEETSVVLGNIVIAHSKPSPQHEPEDGGGSAVDTGRIGRWRGSTASGARLAGCRHVRSAHPGQFQARSNSSRHSYGAREKKNIGGKTPVRSSSVMDFQNGIGRMIGWDIA
jgi:hypothetical protein